MPIIDLPGAICLLNHDVVAGILSLSRPSARRIIFSREQGYIQLIGAIGLLASIAKGDINALSMSVAIGKGLVAWRVASLYPEIVSILIILRSNIGIIAG